MKTPWKFLAQLVSRRRPSAKAQESSIGNDANPKALESDVEHVSALPRSSAVAAGPPALQDVTVDRESADKASDDGVGRGLNPPIDAEETRPIARHEAGHSGAGANALVPKSPASPKSRSRPRTKRKERVKRANTHVAAQSAAAPKRHQSLQPSSSRDLFFHEVATLDEEIKMLRTQLAQKLHRQNVQLKKMLERFDIS